MAAVPGEIQNCSRGRRGTCCVHEADEFIRLRRLFKERRRIRAQQALSRAAKQPLEGSIEIGETVSARRCQVDRFGDTACFKCFFPELRGGMSRLLYRYIANEEDELEAVPSVAGRTVGMYVAD